MIISLEDNVGWKYDKYTYTFPHNLQVLSSSFGVQFLLVKSVWWIPIIWLNNENETRLQSSIIDKTILDKIVRTPIGVKNHNVLYWLPWSLFRGESLPPPPACRERWQECHSDETALTEILCHSSCVSLLKHFHAEQRPKCLQPFTRKQWQALSMSETFSSDVKQRFEQKPCS